MRNIAVISVARSDLGIYTPILERIQEDDQLHLHLVVGGMHLSPEFGFTADLVEKQGFRIDSRVEMLLSSDSPEGIAKSMGVGIIGFAQEYARLRPDLLVVLGDRYEMYAAAVAALPFKIPVAHIHGGELTLGAIDDAFRHSLTKLSHLHFVSTEEHGHRVIQMGEEPWRVFVVGAPGLDNLRKFDRLSHRTLSKELGFPMQPPPLLVTFHPVTLEFEDTEWHVTQLLEALDLLDLPTIFTSPNADTGGRIIVNMIVEYVQSHDLASYIENLGTEAYFSLMSLAAVMVGNSSSGIIEAASFKLPVVNVGMRQKGRLRGRNVIDVSYNSAEICRGIKKALTSEFRRSLRDMENPYGDGRASAKIVDQLREIPLNDLLIQKLFYDLQWEEVNTQ